MSLEIRSIFEYRPGCYLPCGLDIWQSLWWRFMPGVIINVKWPTGEIVVDHNDPRWEDCGGARYMKFESADPNDHYRPDLERLVGRQGWDWNWGLQDLNNNRLTIKIRKKYAIHATVLALKWA